MRSGMSRVGEGDLGSASQVGVDTRVGPSIVQALANQPMDSCGLRHSYPN
jgi:hypothetical protein